MISDILFVCTCVATVVSTVKSTNGDWKLEYPPWGETGSPAHGAPKVWFPMILPFTRHGCGPSRYMSMRIAVNHVNRRDSTFCPAIATLKNKFELVYDIADSNANGIISAKAILKFLNNRSVTVKVVLGPNSSGSSMSMSNILAVFKIAHMSWAATNARLSNKDDYPMFFRVVAPDSFTASKLAGWLHTLGYKTTNLAFFDASYQSGQAADFLQAAKVSLGLTVNEYKMPSSGAGGAPISDANMLLVKNVLTQILLTKIRVVVLIAINEEAYNFFQAVHAMKMMAEPGWLWCGCDGLSQGMARGDVERVKYFEGVVYLMAYTQGVHFPAYQQKWSDLMPSTARPEFSEFQLCYDKATDLEGVCAGNSDFKGWQDGSHDAELKCTGYTPLAYDAVVTLAIVADAMISKGKDINAVTNADWLEEMRALSTPGFSFECLTGQVSFNENQERDMALGMYNWQTGSVVPTLVMTWDGIDGYKWVVGAKVVWPGVSSNMVNDSSRIPVPSGKPPACNIGSVYNIETMMCEACPNNTFFLDNLGVCACEPGFAGNDTIDGCYMCEAGKFTSSPGKSKCEDCPAGSFANTAASTECIACSLGQYQGQAGSTACKSCSPGETTIMTSLKSSDGCKCAPGKYQPFDGGVCTDCPDGMICEFGSSAHNFKVHGGSDTNIPLLEKGYSSQPEEPLFIYECLHADACPGGIPGSCTGQREGLVCALCPDSYAVNKEQGDCQKCEGGMTFLVVVSPILIIMVIFGMYYAGNDHLTVNASISLTTTVSLGIIVCSCQVLSVFRLLSVPWPAKFSPLLDAMSVLNLNPDVVTLECTMGTDATILYLLRILVPIVLVALLFLTYGFVNVVAVLLPIQRWVFDKVLNTVGQVFQTLFIPFAVIAVRPFECFPHPNKESSMMLFPHVLCGSSVHTPLVILSIFFALVVLLPFVAVCIVANIRAPYLSSTSNSIDGANRFLMRFRFLLYRFRPDMWWWGSIYLLRQILLAFAPSLPSDDPHAQIIYTCIVLSLYLMLLMCYWPWKNRSLNLLDSVSTYLLQLIIIVATNFTPKSPNGSTYLTICFILASFLGVCVCSIMLSVLINVVRKGFFAPFEDQFGAHVHAHDLASKFVKCSESLISLGSDKCETLIHIMNQHDREVMLSSIQIWGTVFNDFVPPENRKSFDLGTKTARLANVQYLDSKSVNVSAFRKDMRSVTSELGKKEQKHEQSLGSVNSPVEHEPKPQDGEVSHKKEAGVPGAGPLGPRALLLDWGVDVQEGSHLAPRSSPRLYGSRARTRDRIDLLMNTPG